MSRLELLLLGPPRIEREGQAITVDTRKAIALIAYLAVTHQQQSRDRLAALLWLMQLYAWAGQRAAALHQYRECVQVLDQELGVAPLEATTQLYQAIKENQLPPRPTQWQPSGILSQAPTASGSTTRASGSLTQATPNAAADFPLIGRTSEWAALAAAYNSSRTNGHIVIIEGEAGIGKTRLAEEFLAEERRAGTTTIAARCYEGETYLAYGPIVASLRTAHAQPGLAARLSTTSAHWLSETARLLPELACHLCRRSIVPARKAVSLKPFVR